MTIEEKIIKEITRLDDYGAELQNLQVEVEEDGGLWIVDITITRQFLEQVATRDEHGWGQQYSEVVDQKMYVTDATYIDSFGDIVEGNLNTAYIESQY